MTTFDYSSARDTADVLLAEFGQPVRLRRLTNSGTAFAPTQGVTDYATIAAIVDLTRWYAPTIEGTDILRTDRRGLISAGPLTALGVQAQKFDQLLLASGAIFKILDVKPIAPAGLIVMYDAWLRI